MTVVLHHSLPVMFTYAPGNTLRAAKPYVVLRYVCVSLLQFCFLPPPKVWGLYKGIASPLLGFSAMNSIQFGVYDNCLHRLEHGFTHHPSLLHAAIAGSLGGLAQVPLAVPMELVRIRMQVQGVGEKGKSFFSLHQTSRAHRLYENSLDCATKLYRSHGLPGLYQGVLVTICRDVPGCAVYYAMWEYLCRKFTQMDETRHDMSVPSLMMAGGLCGVAGWASVYPLDVMKTRLQIDGAGSAPEYTGMLDCIAKSYRQEGVRVFFRGITATIVRAFPCNAATLMAYALVNRYFHRRRYEL